MDVQSRPRAKDRPELFGKLAKIFAVLAALADFLFRWRVFPTENPNKRAGAIAELVLGPRDDQHKIISVHIYSSWGG